MQASTWIFYISLQKLKLAFKAALVATELVAIIVPIKRSYINRYLILMDQTHF